MEGSPAFPQKVNRVAMGPNRPTARPVPMRVDNITSTQGLAHQQQDSPDDSETEWAQTGHGVSLSPKSLMLIERSQTEKLTHCVIRYG